MRVRVLFKKKQKNRSTIKQRKPSTVKIHVVQIRFFGGAYKRRGLNLNCLMNGLKKALRNKQKQYCFASTGFY